MAGGLGVAVGFGVAVDLGVPLAVRLGDSVVGLASVTAGVVESTGDEPALEPEVDPEVDGAQATVRPKRASAATARRIS
jgi:hypothetical protein